MISVYGTSNKPHLWKGAYNSISVTKQKFEFIFSGPEKPEDWSLPSNFKFLKTNVKPAQGQQAALWECQGEHVCCISDDAVFDSDYGEGFLDTLVRILEETIDGKGDDKVAISPKFKDQGRRVSQPFIRRGASRGPHVSLNAAIVRKSFMDRLGGWDNRFIGPYALIDIAMEMWSRGGVIYPTRHSFINETNYDKLRICGYLKRYDRPLLTKLWHRPAMPDEKVPSDKAWGYHIVPTEVISKKRMDIFRPFEKEGILEKSQGYNIPDFGWD